MPSFRRAACTIVSRNYLAYASVLSASFKQVHPDYEFYVLLVDASCPPFEHPNCELVNVADLEIPNFKSIAFKYDIVELNTAVKPSFLKYLIEKKGIDQILYFDPDIYIFRSVEFIYDLLQSSGVVLTPHIVDPMELPTPLDKEMLGSGVFNLGFIGVSRSDIGLAFLKWWEERCLTLGYNDPRNGLFVDQKWVNYAPCLFESVHVLRHVGCNVAYWNVTGRKLTTIGSEVLVNGEVPLVFFHFSGGFAGEEPRLSKYSKLTLEARPDLRDIVVMYRAKVAASGARDEDAPYCFGTFSNGARVTKLARIVYAMNEVGFEGEDPFDVTGPFFKRAKHACLLDRTDSSGKYNSQNYNPNDLRIRVINKLFRLALRLLGADRYTMLMKYLAYSSILRNQGRIFIDFDQNEKAIQKHTS